MAWPESVAGEVPRDTPFSTEAIVALTSSRFSQLQRAPTPALAALSESGSPATGVTCLRHPAS
ncbi:MAG TPA: hypothetical protein VI730_12035 [Burkholderiales bacterium]|nr:hypothetical protein [Burkholderiales bacterium]